MNKQLLQLQCKALIETNFEQIKARTNICFVQKSFVSLILYLNEKMFAIVQ